MKLVKLLSPPFELDRIRRGFKWVRDISGSGRHSLAEKYLRHGVEGGLGALLILLLASFWWPQPRPSAPVITARLNAPVITPPGDTADAIVAAHLFGQAQSNAAPAARPATSITVDGIVYAGQAGGSEVALTINGQSNVYRVGEVLPDGEKVAAIDAASVTLAANGASRNLSISKYGDPGSEGPAAYAALLHGTGPNSSSMSIPVGYAGLAQGSLAQSSSFLPPASQAIPSSPTGSAPRIVQLPANVTPLTQLRSLRAQLIR